MKNRQNQYPNGRMWFYYLFTLTFCVFNSYMKNKVKMGKFREEFVFFFLKSKQKKNKDDDWSWIDVPPTPHNTGLRLSNFSAFQPRWRRNSDSGKYSPRTNTPRSVCSLRTCPQRHPHCASRIPSIVTTRTLFCLVKYRNSHRANWEILVHLIRKFFIWF